LQYAKYKPAVRHDRSESHLSRAPHDQPQSRSGFSVPETSKFPVQRHQGILYLCQNFPSPMAYTFS
jgi:hypothetical protein